MSLSGSGTCRSRASNPNPSPTPNPYPSPSPTPYPYPAPNPSPHQVPELRVDDAIVHGPLPLMTLWKRSLWEATPHGFDEALPKG
jgi:hypothetical protein